MEIQTPIVLETKMKKQLTAHYKSKFTTQRINLENSQMDNT